MKMYRKLSIFSVPNLDLISQNNLSVTEICETLVNLPVAQIEECGASNVNV